MTSNSDRQLELAQHGVDQLAVRGRRERESEAFGRESADSIDGAGDDGQLGLVAREHPPDDLGVDHVRWLLQPDRPRGGSATTRASSCPSSPAAPRACSGRPTPQSAPRGPRPRGARCRRGRRPCRRRRPRLVRGWARAGSYGDQSGVWSSTTIVESGSRRRRNHRERGSRRTGVRPRRHRAPTTQVVADLHAAWGERQRLERALARCGKAVTGEWINFGSPSSNRPGRLRRNWLRVTRISGASPLRFPPALRVASAGRRQFWKQPSPAQAELDFDLARLDVCWRPSRGGGF